MRSYDNDIAHEGNHRHRSSRLVVGVVLFVVVVVGCAAGVYSGSALVVYGSVLQTQSGDTEGLVEQGEIPVGAPSLPFRGVVGYYGDVFFPVPPDPYPYPGFGLLYWNAADLSLLHVPLGDSVDICGPGQIMIHPDGVEVLYVDALSYNTNIFRVPWGDDAYPAFLPSLGGVSWSGVSAMRVNEEFVVEEVDDGVFKFRTPQQERYYSLNPVGLYYEGEEYAVSEAQHPEWEEDYSTLDMLGSDGRHYGFSSTPDEPACGPQLSLVFSGVTGELVACGWSYFGPVLSNMDGSFAGIEDPVFPMENSAGTSESCDQVLDVRDFAVKAAESSGEDT